MPSEPVQEVHLHRTDENIEEIEALAGLTGGRAGLDGVLADLNRRARRSPLPLGRAAHRAWRWDTPDCRTPRWWPQGITTADDASTAGLRGRRLLVTTWYSKEVDGVNKGARLTFLDLDSRRYRHVLLVVPGIDEDGRVTLAPLEVHAGGIVWAGPYLHIAATSRGFMTCRVDDILRVPDEIGLPEQRHSLGLRDGRLASMGYRYVLPVRFSYRAHAAEGHERLRYSFMSLDAASDPPQLVVGEYGRGRQTTRLARFPLDPESFHLVAGEDGHSRPLLLDDAGVRQMQGIVEARGRYYATASNGPLGLGSVYVGRPGTFRKFRWATPMGCEDVAWSPSTDLLWSVTEHPWRRWVFTMRRGWFDRRATPQSRGIRAS